MEVDDELSAAGVLELAWTTGLIKWEDDPTAGLVRRRVRRAGGRGRDRGALPRRSRGAMSASASSSTTARSTPITPSPLLVSVFLDKDFIVRRVAREADARAFVQADPEHTVARAGAGRRDWQVTRKAGTEIRVPRKTKLSRTVGAQIPTGFDPTVWGISADMAELDRPGGAVEHRRHRRRVPVVAASRRPS